MISKEIKAVAGTKLFCGVNNEKTKQITINGEKKRKNK